ncbi:MAG: hypothetical protein AAF629_08420 [Chloroflexota bacterium]
MTTLLFLLHGPMGHTSLTIVSYFTETYIVIAVAFFILILFISHQTTLEGSQNQPSEADSKS